MGIVAAYAVPHPPLIVPAVGRGDERAIQATVDAYNQVAREIVALDPDLIVLTSPHAPFFRDAFHITTDPQLNGDMAQFGAPKTRVEASCDVEFAQALIGKLGDDGILAVGSEQYPSGMDHATFVGLFFVLEAFKEAGGAAEVGRSAFVPCPIVRVGLSMLSFETHRQVGHHIAKLADEAGKRVVFLASGDLSHKLKEDGPYGFVPEGPVFDAKIGEIFSSGELEGLFEFDPAFADAAAECGLRSFQIMAGAIEGRGFASELLSLEGPFGVGYGVAAFRDSK